MSIGHQSPVIAREQKAHGEIDAGLRSLRIDRSSGKTRKRLRRGMRWILLAIGLVAFAGAGWVVYSRLNAAIEVETVRVRPVSATSFSDVAGATILNATGYIIAAHKIELASR